MVLILLCVLLSRFRPSVVLMHLGCIDSVRVKVLCVLLRLFRVPSVSVRPPSVRVR